MKKMIKIIVSLIIPVILIILFFRIIFPFLNVRNEDIQNYIKKSEWIRFDNLELIESNRNLSIGSMESLLFQDTTTHKYYLLGYYPKFRGQIFTFDIHVKSVYLYINKNELDKGSLEFPILALNYATFNDLYDQLPNEDYIRNVKSYLRYDKNDKYISANTMKLRKRVLLFIALLSISITIFGFGYYVYLDKKEKNNNPLIH